MPSINKNEIKTFSDDQKLGELVASSPRSKEIFKHFFRPEERNLIWKI